ncbi:MULTISPECIES: hypothetical protein [Erwinia]|uniref:Polyketide cyclase n=2 Tax=Erwinia TaxID=551 RepID=A0A014NRX5_9GAMM|nr:hypothetical protein [Erwinia mallotivora]EXU76620.1 polyketide cyclase [Erwinia mallotivora]
MLSSQTVSLAIPRNWVDLYETIWKPDYFPKWATGLTASPLVQEGNYWKSAESGQNLKIRFTDHNPFGVMDHYIDSGSGREVYMPMRVIPNEQGAEVLITVFRQPLMSDEKFAQDIEAVKRDLQTLHTLLTT